MMVVMVGRIVQMLQMFIDICSTFLANKFCLCPITGYHHHTEKIVLSLDDRGSNQRCHLLRAHRSKHSQSQSMIMVISLMLMTMVIILMLTMAMLFDDDGNGDTEDENGNGDDYDHHHTTINMSHTITSSGR